MQKRRNYRADALELRLFCFKPLKYNHVCIRSRRDWPVSIVHVRTVHHCIILLKSLCASFLLTVFCIAWSQWCWTQLGTSLKVVFPMAIDNNRMWKKIDTSKPRDSNIYVSKQGHHWFRYGSSPDQYQAIIWTSYGFLLIGTLGTDLNESWIEIPQFSYEKMNLKMSLARWQPFFGSNMLKEKKVFSAVWRCAGWGIMNNSQSKDVPNGSKQTQGNALTRFNHFAIGDVGCQNISNVGAFLLEPATLGWQRLRLTVVCWRVDVPTALQCVGKWCDEPSLAANISTGFPLGKDAVVWRHSNMFRHMAFPGLKLERSQRHQTFMRDDFVS